MAQIRSGLFSLAEFNERNVLKLAPDAFITVSGGINDKVVMPISSSGTNVVTKDLEMRGGISSINVTAAVSPPGSGRATITIIAPQYKGLHEDYYVTLPTGVKIPYFIAMMEVKIYMKGRYLDDADFFKPKYYPVFWGFITEVSESYNSGNFTISLTCSDMLAWWKFTNIILVPSNFTAANYGPPANRFFPTIFKNLNPWEIIFTLFNDSFFMNPPAANFVYPQPSSTQYISLLIETLKRVKDNQSFSALTKNVNDYWNKRFGFEVKSGADVLEKVPLEMYGLQGQINMDSILQSSETKFRSSLQKGDGYTPVTKELDLDYGILARLQPFGAYKNFGTGAKTLEHSKLDIAQQVCDWSNLEFFQDTNGRFVFKPPFYNLNVMGGGVPEYEIEPKDLINISTSIVSDSIVNYLELTAPQFYNVLELEFIGYHIDIDLLKRFGLRFRSLPIMYGNNAKELNMIAAAQMSVMNAKAFTGNVTIPLRPEVRLGYPVYITHMDSFYYITSIQHNFNFGSSATTSLNLEGKRERVFDGTGTEAAVDGQTSYVGNIMRGYVYRWAERYVPPVQESFTNDSDPATSPNPNDVKTNKDMDAIRRNSGVISGPDTTGFYTISKAMTTSDDTKQATPGDTSTTIVSNELVMITDKTVPYTDINGYRHLGAFPYGANLMLQKNGVLMDLTNITSKTISNAAAIAGVGLGDGTQSPGVLSGQSLTSTDDLKTSPLKDPNSTSDTIKKSTTTNTKAKTNKTLNSTNPAGATPTQKQPVRPNSADVAGVGLGRDRLRLVP